jgi:arogenate/prephenate dehydratase
MQFISAHNLRDTGAVASARAAEIYGLEILMDGIQVFSFFFWSFCS